MNRTGRSWLLRLSALGLFGTALAACGGSGSAASSSSTSTLPPLPPSVIAYVSLAGSGSTVGYGHAVVPVTVTASSGGQQVGKKIKVGSYPDAIAIAPDGLTAYVANYTANTVTPIDLATDKPEKPISAGIGPADIAIAPDGKTAYVTDDGSATVLGDTVTPIDLKTNKAEAPITVGQGPQGIVITPDGSTAYVADAGAIVTGQSGGVGNTVTPIDLATHAAGKPITVGNGPTGIAVSPDGTQVFVTNLDSGSVSPITVASNAAGAPITVPGGPVAIAVAAGSAWVVDTPSTASAGDNVVPIAVASDTAGSPISVAKGAQDIAITPNQKTAWVACLNADQLVPIDLATSKAGTPIRVVGGPFALAIVSEAQGGSHPDDDDYGVVQEEEVQEEALIGSGARQPPDAPEAVPDGADGLDQVGLLLTELGPKPPHMDVDGAGTAEVLIAPHSRQQNLASEDLARVCREETEQLVLHEREVERTAGEGSLVGLEVEGERAIDDEVVLLAPPGAPEQVGKARLDLGDGSAGDDEVVEQVLSQLEVAELSLVDDEQEGRQRRLPLSERAAEQESGVALAAGHHDRPGPAVLRLEAGGEVGVAHRLPRVGRRVEHAGQPLRWRVREDEQGVHRHQFWLSVFTVPAGSGRSRTE